MKIRTVKVRNYKSFFEPGETTLGESFNLIVGKNNTGKTAFLEAASLTFEDKPHISLTTKPRIDSNPEGVSKVEISFELKKEELKELIYDNFRVFWIPRDRSKNENEQQDVVDQLFNDDVVIIRSIFGSSGVIQSWFEKLGNYSSDVGMQYEIEDITKSPKIKAPNVSARNQKKISHQLCEILKDRIYFFKAERFNVGEHVIGQVSKLNSDASNLAQVLHNLQASKTEEYLEFVQEVQSILPDVKHITIPPHGDPPLARILLWGVDSQSQRNDLTIPLQESGTGIGQVLAILYVALTSYHPSVILIDEPQSFLHPGAVKKLLDTLRLKYSQHQYILSTHSPVVVSHSYQSKFLLFIKGSSGTVIEEIDAHESSQLNHFLDEVGASLSDVFSADQVLWVEGKTEERCFPIIIERILKKQLLGISIIGLVQVGDFEGKLSKTAYQIYKRISTSANLVPPAIGLIFDREKRSETDREDLIRESQGLVRFLPRRMFENYLLNPEAIASLISTLEDFSDQPIKPEDIRNWFKSNTWNSKYLNGQLNDIELPHDEWERDLNSAMVLDDLFNDLSNNRYEYLKVEYGVQLTDWICKNSPEDFKELAVFLSEVLSD